MVLPAKFLLEVLVLSGEDASGVAWRAVCRLDAVDCTHASATCEHRESSKMVVQASLMVMSALFVYSCLFVLCCVIGGSLLFFFLLVEKIAREQNVPVMCDSGLTSEDNPKRARTPNAPPLRDPLSSLPDREVSPRTVL